MATDLKNTFSWSFSAASDFDECPRRRFLAKYAMWGGWDRSASELSKVAYRLTKMDSRFSIQGKAAEDAVMWLLRDAQRDIDHTGEEAYQVARKVLNTAWMQSREGKWMQRPKQYCCLHEHYYQDLSSNKEREKELIKGIADTVKTCIANFIDKVLPRLKDVRSDQEVDVATVVNSRDPESFELDGLKIYAIPDYVYTDGLWNIVDWKSGKQKDMHNDQVDLYGLWANVKHGAAAEDIEVHLEYLKTGETVSHRLTGECMDRVREKITNSVNKMRKYLLDGDTEANIPIAEDQWPRNTNACRHCNFIELCQ